MTPREHIPRAAGWRLHTPNALVFVRLLLACAVFWLLASHEPGHRSRLLIAAGLFVAAAATDAADGYLARRWNAITRFGRVMDPFADKILILGAFVLLAGPAFESQGQNIAGFTGLMTVAILARELLVTSLRGLIESGGGDFSATASGKLKMILQSVAIPVVLLVIAFDPWGDLGAQRSTGRLLNTSIAWTTTIVTVLSGIPYIRAAVSASAKKI